MSKADIGANYYDSDSSYKKYLPNDGVKRLIIWLGRVSTVTSTEFEISSYVDLTTSGSTNNTYSRFSYAEVVCNGQSFTLSGQALARAIYISMVGIPLDD